VLNQQLKTLKAEVRGICQRFGSTFNLPPHQYPKTIEAVNKIFYAKIIDLQEINALVEYDCDAIIDLAQRDRCIDRLM